MQVENSSQQWDCSCDIEIAFIDLSVNELHQIIDNFQIKGYSLEDKSHLGWGSVISRDEEWVGDRRKISYLIGGFLSEFDDVIRAVHKSFPKIKSILRIGVYYDSFSLTLPFYQDSIKHMEQAGVDVEVSLYPSTTE